MSHAAVRRSSKLQGHGSRTRSIIVAALVLLTATSLAVTPLLNPDTTAAVDNLLTKSQQTFESDPVGWDASDVARSWRTRTFSAQGRYSLLVVANAKNYDGTTPMHATTSTGTAGVRVRPGSEYTGTFQVRPWKDFTDHVACELTWYRADGSFIGGSMGPWTLEAPNSWKSMKCTAVAPSDAVFAALRVRFHSVYQGDVHYIDNAGLVGPPVSNQPPAGSDEFNLLESEQHSFESSLQGWVTQGNASTLRSTTAAAAGAASMQIVGSATDPVYVDSTRTIRVGTMPGTDGIEAIVGHMYEGRVQVLSTTSSSFVRCELRWYHPDGSILTTSFGPEALAVKGVWGRHLCRAVAPTGAAYAALRLHISNAGVGDSFYLDDAWLVDMSDPSGTTTPPATTAPATTAPATTQPPATTPPATTAPATTPPPPTTPPATTPPATTP